MTSFRRAEEADVDEEILKERRKALEEEFFQKESERLRKMQRAKYEREVLREEIREVTGIRDPQAIELLVDLGVRAETIAALTLIPLVEVAWADGKLDEPERRAILAGAAEAGISASHPSRDLFAGWLSQRPDPRLLEVWTQYVHAIAERLDSAKRNEVRERLLTRARRVAEAAGGFLGMGRKVSPEEEKTLQVLARAFDV